MNEPDGLSEQELLDREQQRQEQEARWQAEAEAEYAAHVYCETCGRRHTAGSALCFTDRECGDF